jgi:hypothetical protein
MNHLAQQQYPFVRIFFNSLVADLNGILDSIAKAKVPGDEENCWAKVKCCWRKILLTKIFDSSRFLDLTCYGRPVVGGYIELFYSKAILTNCKVRRKLAQSLASS